MTRPRHPSACTFVPGEAHGPPARCRSHLFPTGPRPGARGARALSGQTLPENRPRGGCPHASPQTRGHGAEDAGLQQRRADSEAEPPHVALCTPSVKGQAYGTATRTLLRSRDLRRVSGP